MYVCMYIRVYICSTQLWSTCVNLRRVVAAEHWHCGLCNGRSTYDRYVSVQGFARNVPQFTGVTAVETLRYKEKKTAHSVIHAISGTGDEIPQRSHYGSFPPFLIPPYLPLDPQGTENLRHRLSSDIDLS